MDQSGAWVSPRSREPALTTATRSPRSSPRPNINHAILTEAEFTTAVPRLIALDFVGAHVEADRYWHTDAGQVLRELWSRRGACHGRSERTIDHPTAPTATQLQPSATMNI